MALLDDGVERNHPDLAFWEPVKDDEESDDDARADGDSAPGEEELFPGEPVSPEDRHGTACAGVLGAIANNGIGIAGVAPGALLLPLHRGIDDLSIVRAIDAAVEHGAHVLVIPWGWTGAAPRGDHARDHRRDRRRNDHRGCRGRRGAPSLQRCRRLPLHAERARRP